MSTLKFSCSNYTFVQWGAWLNLWESSSGCDR